MWVRSQANIHLKYFKNHFPLMATFPLDDTVLFEFCVELCVESPLKWR